MNVIYKKIMDWTDYLDDKEMIEIYERNFDLDVLEEFIEFCAEAGMNRDSIGEMLMGYKYFVEMWITWEQIRE